MRDTRSCDPGGSENSGVASAGVRYGDTLIGDRVGRLLDFLDSRLFLLQILTEQLRHISGATRVRIGDQSFVDGRFVVLGL